MAHLLCALTLGSCGQSSCLQDENGFKYLTAQGAIDKVEGHNSFNQKNCEIKEIKLENIEKIPTYVLKTYRYDLLSLSDLTYNLYADAGEIKYDETLLAYHSSRRRSMFRSHSHSSSGKSRSYSKTTTLRNGKVVPSAYKIRETNPNLNAHQYYNEYCNSDYQQRNQLNTTYVLGDQNDDLFAKGLILHYVLSSDKKDKIAVVHGYYFVSKYEPYEVSFGATEEKAKENYIQSLKEKKVLPLSTSPQQTDSIKKSVKADF